MFAKKDLCMILRFAGRQRLDCRNGTAFFFLHAIEKILVAAQWLIGLRAGLTAEYPATYLHVVE